MTYALILHGGTSQAPDPSPSEGVLYLAEVAHEGEARLKAGQSALDVVVHCVSLLEQSGYYIAGKGAGPNTAGQYELDASIMCGRTRRAGAVCALNGFKHPIKIARDVLEHSRHVLLAGEGANRFAQTHKHEEISDPQNYYTVKSVSTSPDDLDMGTCGVVALDLSGALAAGTSTGGLMGKLQGRVGDSPLIGAGCWADETVAVSCTGQGEYFMKTACASDISARMRYGDQGLAQACTGAIEAIGALGGYGGVIALNATGQTAQAFNCGGFRRAWRDEKGVIHRYGGKV